MEEKRIETNSMKAWLLAARPKTLSGAAVPVMIGVALAYVDAEMYGEDVGWQPSYASSSPLSCRSMRISSTTSSILPTAPMMSRRASVPVVLVRWGG